VAAGVPVAIALATADGTALAEAGGTEATMLAAAVGVAGMAVGVAGSAVAVAGATVGAVVGVVVAGAGVVAGEAQAIATSPRAINETDLRCLMGILLCLAEDSQIAEFGATHFAAQVTR